MEQCHILRMQAWCLTFLNFFTTQKLVSSIKKDYCLIKLLTYSSSFVSLVFISNALVKYFNSSTMCFYLLCLLSSKFYEC